MSDSIKSVKALRIPLWKASLFVFLWLGILLSGLPAQEQEEEENRVFKGVGIHLRLGGGYNLFSGGDFKTGIRGMYALGRQMIVSSGFTLGQSDESPLNSGFELGGDLVYYFAGRLGLGVGVSFTQAKRTIQQLYRYGAIQQDYAMRLNPRPDVYSYRLGVFYTIPLNRLLTVCFNAGPAFYSVQYLFSWSSTLGGYAYQVSQNLKAKDWGAHGGLGLEIRMNERLAFILEAQARYAKISGFEGTERLYEYVGGPSSTTDTNGTLFYVEQEGFPRLEVFSGAPAAGSSREAVFDFSGVSLRAGLNFKF